MVGTMLLSLLVATWTLVECAVMSGPSPDKSNAIVPVKSTPNAQPVSVVVDDAGRTIIAMLQKASEVAKDDCDRAMDTVHRLSFELRAAEERMREAEAEVAHFRERASRAEAWLLRIHYEAEQAFLQKNEREPRRAPIEGNVRAPSPRDNRSDGRANDVRAPSGDR
jgi:hypothetical protein